MGEELTFIKQEGDKLLVENKVQPGAGPVMHVHWQQEEEIEVVSGLCGYEYGDGRTGVLKPGEKVLFKRGEFHRFWAQGSEVLRCKGWIGPAGNIEYFLTELYKSIDANDGKQPGPMDSVFLLTRYKS